MMVESDTGGDFVPQCLQTLFYNNGAEKLPDLSFNCFKRQGHYDPAVEFELLIPGSLQREGSLIITILMQAPFYGLIAPSSPGVEPAPPLTVRVPV